MVRTKIADVMVTRRAGECARAAECRRDEPSPARREKSESGHEIEEHYVGRHAGMRTRASKTGRCAAALEGRVSRCMRRPNNRIFRLARRIRLAACKVEEASATTADTLLAYGRAARELKIPLRGRGEPAIGSAKKSAGIREQS